MSNCKFPMALIGLMIVVGLSLQLWYWPQLPERLAIHFDAQGIPNDWMDKLPATLLSAGLVALLPFCFVGISQITRWLPSSLINLPYREYWLAPERRDESLRWMMGWMMWFAVAITIFVVVLNHLTFIANRDSQPLSAGWFWGVLGAFLFSTFLQVIIMIRRFYKPTSSGH
jgi:uncharacterized membrane protein